MPSPDDYDDYDDYRPSRNDVPFPRGIKIAGIIWICFGVIGLLNAAASLAIVVIAAGSNPGSTICGALIALGYLIVGIQTVKGTAKGTVGNGITSLFFALLYGAVAVLIITLNPLLPGGPNSLLWVVATLSCALAVAMAAAGVLAIRDRDAYANWQSAHGRGQPRRRTVEEEDYDDERPRRLGEPEEDDRRRSNRDLDSER
jgi:hypothetical protein